MEGAGVEGLLQLLVARRLALCAPHQVACSTWGRHVSGMAWGGVAGAPLPAAFALWCAACMLPGPWRT